MNDIDFGYVITKYNRKSGDVVDRAFLAITNDNIDLICFTCKFFRFTFSTDTYSAFVDTAENVVDAMISAVSMATREYCYRLSRVYKAIDDKGKLRLFGLKFTNDNKECLLEFPNLSNMMEVKEYPQTISVKCFNDLPDTEIIYERLFAMNNIVIEG